MKTSALFHHGLLLAGLLVSVPALAQDEPAPDANSGMKSTFGVKGGANWSNLWAKEVNDKNARFGFHFGVFGRFASENSAGFQIEALYDQKGETVKKSYNGLDQEITYRFDYIDVPAMVVIPLGKVLELQAGGYVGYMVLSEVRTDGDFGEGTIDPSDGKFNGFDYGLVGGAGLNLGMAQAGVRYEHGMNEIAKGEVARDVLGNAKNSTLQLYLALALGKQ